MQNILTFIVTLDSIGIAQNILIYYKYKKYMTEEVLRADSNSIDMANNDDLSRKAQMSLKLADIIYVVSPSNKVFNDRTLFIYYIDLKTLILVDVDTAKFHKLRIHESGVIGDGTIEEIRLLERSLQEGYARQNGLLPGKWINIYFAGETPFVLTGEITNLEEDMVEITTYPDNDVVFIDFGYKGIPLDLPIDRIELRRSPPKVLSQVNESVRDDGVDMDNADNFMDDDNDENDVEYNEEEMETDPVLLDNQTTAEDSVEDSNTIQADSSETDLEPGEIRENRREKAQNTRMTKPERRIQQFIISADQRMLGDFLAPVATQQKRLETHERYDIQHQSDDLLDDIIMKSKILGDTSPLTTRKLRTEVERFIELREEFSKIDNYGNVIGPNFHTATWKPLINALEQLDRGLKWIVPIIKNIQRLEVDIQDVDSIIDADFQKKIADELSVISTIYLKGGNGELVNHYRTYVDSLSRTFQSAIDPDPEDKEIIASIYATRDVMTIVDNLGNFQASRWGQTSRGSTQKLINECRMSTYRYEEPSTYLSDRDDITDKAERTPREKSGAKELINIKSIMTLPYSVTKFSRVDLPMTSIGNKVGYINAYSYYHKFISRKAKVQRIVVDKFQSGNAGYNTGTYNTTNMYHLNVPRTILANLSQREIYHQYIQSIIPKTRKILDAVSAHATGAMSMKDYVSVLEPYLVYMKDLTFSHYSVIKGHLSGNIKQYIDTYTTNVREFRKIKGLRNTTQYTNKRLKSLIDGAMQGTVFEKYNKAHNNYSTSEYLSRIIQTDGGRLFYDAVTIKQVDSLLHDDMSTALNSIYSDETSEKNANSSTDKCKVYMMTKHYITIDDLVADNGADIYYDKKYDTTNYGLLINKDEPYTSVTEKFAAEYARMHPDEFFEFIRGKVERAVPKGTPDIEHLTETLIRGKKRVRDGEYAMLFLLDEGEQQYYIRKNNTWKADNTVGKETQFVTTATDCNLQRECIAIVQNGMDAKCDIKNNRRADIRANTLKTLIGLLETQYFATRDELRKYVTDKFERDYLNIDIIKTKRVSDVCKYDDYQYREGMKIANMNIETIKSPYSDLLQSILSQSDIGKKYADLMYFINRYTEEHTNQELEHGDPEEMLYCKTTKRPLVPLYYRTLATAWLKDDGDFAKPNFMTAIDQVVRKYGKESNDGECWVDVNSGREIIKKAFDTDEGYDNTGRRNVSREIVKEDFETKYLAHIEKVSQLKNLYTSPETRIMFNIVVTLSNAMSIQTASIVEFVISLASTVLQKPGVFFGEKEYRDIANEKAKAGEKPIPYKAFYDYTILYLTLGAFLIGVQTAIPGIVTKKTYPGCIRSFSGYPYDNSGDKTSVEYLACVVKGVATPNGVWKIVNRKDATAIANTLVSVIDAHYKDDNRVKQKIHDKVVYSIDHPDEMVPDSVSVSKWLTFMPPVTPVNISKIENITEEYRKLFVSDLKVGSPLQWKKLGVIQGKLLYFSLYPQKSVKDFLMNEAKATSAEELASRGKLLPLFESSKFVANGQIVPFANKDCEVDTANNIVRILETIIKDDALLRTAKMMTCSVDSKNVYPPLRKTFSEETIYLAFIDICDFSRPNISVDPDILPICGDKPERFNKSDTLAERIRKLKHDGHSYDEKHIERLLKINGLKNAVSVEGDNPTVTQLMHMARILENIPANSQYDVLKRHLELLLDTFDVQRENKITDEVRGLRNYLGAENERLVSRIGSFIEDNLSLNSRENRNMYILLKSMTTWGAGEKEIVASQVIQYNCFEFVKRYADNIVHIFPEMILNKVNHKEAWSSAKYAERRLGLSNLTTETINKSNHKYYENIEALYNNPVINHVLRKVQNECKIIIDLLHHTPYFSSVEADNSIISSILDKDTCRMLFKYYMLSVLNTHVSLSSEKDMINFDLTENYGMEELTRSENSTIPEVDPNMLDSDMTKLQNEVARLLYAYLKTMQNHRDIIDTTYIQVINTNFHTRETEKQMMTSRLEELEQNDQMELDKIMRANKMGVWNKGISKGLKKFVKETYDDEREFREKMQEVEKKVRTDKHVTDDNYEQAKDDYLDNLDNYITQDEEDNDLSLFLGDDANGDPEAYENTDLSYMD